MKTRPRATRGSLAACASLLVLLLRCARLATSQQQVDDEPLIVINSMHSGVSLNSGPQVPMGGSGSRWSSGAHQSGRIRPHQAISSSPQNNSFVPSRFQAGPAHLQGHHAHHHHHHHSSQPSQEFESDRFAGPGQAQVTRSNFSAGISQHTQQLSAHRQQVVAAAEQQASSAAQLKQRAPLVRENFFQTLAQQQQQQVAAPYALGTSGPSGASSLDTLNNQHTRQQSAFHFQPAQQPPASLIRDTSQLLMGEQAEENSVLPSQHIPQQQQQQYNNNNNLQDFSSLWVQSVRDNHAGPLRSRFDLPTGSMGGGASGTRGNGSPPAPMPFGLPGPNLHAPRPVGTPMSDGLMKAKWPTNFGHATPLSNLQGPQMPEWQLQAKAARGQVSTPPASEILALAESENPAERIAPEPAGSPAAAAGISRRNSKFTRQAEQTTTPLSSEPPASEPGGTPATSVSANETSSAAPPTTIATPSSTPSTTTQAPNGTQDCEPATGNGQVLPLSETDLLLLGQRFEIDTRAEPAANSSARLNNSSQGAISHEAGQNGSNAHVPLLLSNNHSTKGRPKPPPRSPPRVGRQLGLEARQDSNKQARAGGWSGILPAFLQRTLGGLLRRLTGSSSAGTTSAQQPLAATSTLHTQQLEQTRGQAAFASQHDSHLDSLLASAISAAAAAAAAAAASQQQQQQQKQSFSMGAQFQAPKSELAKQTMASQIDESSASAVTATGGGPARAKPPGLRQHANKKIIDSFVDLPASERRSGPDAQQVVGRRTLESEPSDELRAEPRHRARRAADEESNANADEEPLDESQSDQTGEQADQDYAPALDFRTTTERVSTAGERGGDRSTGGREGPQTADQDLQPAEDNPAGATHLKQMEQPPLEEPEGEETSHAPADEAEAELEDEDSVAADETSPRVQPRASAEQDEPGEAENEPDELARSESSDDLLADASDTNEASGPSLVFYAPQAGLGALGREQSELEPDQEPAEPELEVAQPPPQRVQPAKRRKQVRSTQRPAAKYNRRPQVRPPAEPAESGRPSASTTGGGILPPRRRNNHRPNPNRRTRPQSGLPRPPLHLRPTSGATTDEPPQEVPHLNLEGVRSSVLGVGSASSASGGHRLKGAPRPAAASPNKPKADRTPATRPLSVLVPSVPLAEGEPEAGSALMSPMSSSINVMDLDPSMTRLAHNKLIVAKFKPRARPHKLKSAPPPVQPASPSAAEQSSAQLRSAAGQQQSARLSTPSAWDSTPASAPLSSSPAEQRFDVGTPASGPQEGALSASERREPRPSSAAEQATSVASLASAVLGSRVITNKHISDIISRWTRPVPASAAPNLRPASGAGRPAASATAQVPPTANSQQATVPAGTAPAAGSPQEKQATDETKFAENPQQAKPTSAAGQQVTQQPASPAEYSAPANGQADLEAELNGRAQPKASTTPRPPLDLLLAHQQASPPISRNDKFNFSMAQMNNRERINPLLFPIEMLNRHNAMANNASISSMMSKLKQNQPAQNQRVKLTTTSTSTTTSTTRRPAATSRPNTSSNHHIYHYQSNGQRPASSRSTSTTTSTTTTSTTSTTTASPSISLEPLGVEYALRPEELLELEENSPPSTSTTASSPTSHRPSQEIFVAPTKPTAGAYRPRFKPALQVLEHGEVAPLDEEDENFIGQIVRNQHHHHPHSSPTYSDQMRLRNQYLALVGGGRSNQNSSSAPAASGWPAPPSAENLEEGTRESNRYVTLNGQAGSSQASNLDAGEHSIVIMSDNHKHLRRRPAGQQQSLRQQSAEGEANSREKVLLHNNHGQGGPSQPTRPPPLFASMHYSSQAMDFNELGPATSTISPPPTSTRSAASELAQKYLEEFVNGTRIRPSSSAKTTTTTTSTTSTTTELPLHANHDQSVQFTKNNHARGSPPAGQQQVAQQQQQVANRTSPSGLTPSQQADLLGKLDERAHELLFDLFDRDPTYSASLIAAHQLQAKGAGPAGQQAQVGPLESKEELEQSKGDKLRRVYEQLMASSGRNKSGQNNNKRFEASTTTTPSDRVTAGNLQEHQARSTDSGQAASATTSVPRFESFGSQPTAGPSPVSGDHSDANNRASMRKSQAKIQAILQDLARRNATAGPRTTTAEPQEDLSELASHAQFVRPTAGPTSEPQELLLASAASPAASTTEQVSAANENADLASAESENSNSNKQSSPRSTTPSAGAATPSAEQEDAAASLDLASLTSKTTRFYAPLTSTTPSKPSTQHHRFPIIDTLGAGRQKINKPLESASDGGYFSHSQGPTGGPSDASHILYEQAQNPTTTSKLTESVSNNEQLRHTIRNRVTSPRTTTPMPSLAGEGAAQGGPDEAEGSAEAGEESAAESEVGENHLPEEIVVPHKLAAHNKRRRPGQNQKHQAGTATTATVTFGGVPNEGGENEPPYLQAPFERPHATGDSEANLRPIIIRRKPQQGQRPTRKPAGSPSSGQHRKPVRINLSEPSGAQTTFNLNQHHGQAKPNKRRKKPQAGSGASAGGEQHKRPQVDGEHEPGLTLEPVDFKPSASGRPKPPPGLIMRPAAPPHLTGATQLIRKRPQGGGPFRLPPDNIRIREQQGGNRSHQHVSVIKRKHQDIRTRPLTIVDGHRPEEGGGQGDRGDTPTSSGGGGSDSGRTTILHKNMVVTYKPGRPLPVSTIDRDHAHHHSTVSVTEPSIFSTTPTPAPSSATIFIHSAHGLHNSSGSADELAEGAPGQLGSGNGHETLLVSIEQQQAQQQAQQEQHEQQSNRRPPAHITLHFNESTTTPGPDGTTTTLSPSSASLTTTTTPAPTTQRETISHRPIIVISGLPLEPSGPHGANGSGQHAHKARPSHPSGNSLVESGTMSVVASASHGGGAGGTNSSRPFLGRPHYNSTSSSSGGPANSTQVGGPSSPGSEPSLEGNPFMTGQPTADSIVGPEMPNFGGPSSGGQSSPSSGSNIGMPHFGSLPTSSRPPGYLTNQQQKPYSWRVRKRPNGNAGGSSSHAPYDYHAGSSSSLSTSFYRPLGGGSLAQLFSWSTIAGAFENLQIFLARMRTFLISIMVMFLPPIALTASIVNAMST